jgi:hypothetical protein
MAKIFRITTAASLAERLREPFARPRTTLQLQLVDGLAKIGARASPSAGIGMLFHIGPAAT